MSYVLSCCSTADLSKEHFEKRDINYVCFHFYLDEAYYPDDLGQTMPFDKFYKAMDYGAMTKTSQVNVAEFEDAINRLMNNEEVALSVPREIVGRLKAEHILKIASEGGLSDWAQNELQREAINQIYNLRDRVKSLNNVNLTNAWRLLQSVDNFRPMSLDLTDSNPYGTPYEAFINYMNVLGDFNQVLNSKSTVLSLSEKK